MEKISLLISLFFGLVFFVKAQPPCLPISGGIPPTNDTMGCFLCSPIYQGSTVGYTADAIDFDFPCGTIENSQWIRVESVISIGGNVTVLSSNCTQDLGVELAVYDLDMNLVSDCFSSEGNNVPGNVQIIRPLSLNEELLIMIDGYEGDECDILVTTNLNRTGGLGPPDPPVAPIIVKPDINYLCLGVEICFSHEPISGASTYQWYYPKEHTTLTDSSELEICLKFHEYTGGVIRFNGSDNCFPGVPAIFPIVLSNDDLPPFKICSNDFPVEIGGQIFTDYGEYEIENVSFLGCLPNQQFEIVPDTLLETTQVSRLICSGDTVFVNQTPFFETGKYDVFIEDARGDHCDSLVELDLVVPITEPVKIECVSDSFLNVLSINWSDRPLAENYEVWINDSLIGIQNYRGYLYFSDVPGEILNIKIQPIASHLCAYIPGETTCVMPTFSNTNPALSKKETILYPNPSDGVFQLSPKIRFSSIQVFDFSGKAILESKDSKIDLSQQPSGIYFFKVKTDNGFLIEKAIKLISGF